MQSHNSSLLVLGVGLAFTLIAAASHDRPALAGSQGGSVRGDVTCDGVVNTADVSSLLRRAAGFETHIGCPGQSSTTLLFYAYPSDGVVETQESVIVSVFADIPGALGSWSFDVHFDADVLEAVTCEPIGVSGCNVLTSPAAVRFAGAVGGVGGISGTQHFGDIEFRAVGNVGQSSDITFAISAYDTNGTLLSPIGASGSIEIVAAGSPGPPAGSGYWPPADIDCDGAVLPVDALLLAGRIASGQGTLPDCPVS